MVGLAQNKSLTDLQRMEDESLLEYFNKVSEDSIMAEKVARVYLERARLQEDTIKMARGYDRLARIFHPKKNLMYADSIIALTQDKSHITYPGMGYILTGLNFYYLDDLISSTNSYLKAFEIAEQNNNLSQKVNILDMLIFYQTQWGNPENALRLQNRRHKTISNKDYIEGIKAATRKGYYSSIENELIEDKIMSFETYAACYLKIGKLDSVSFYIDKSIKLIKGYEHINKKNHLKWINEFRVEFFYYMKDYKECVKLVDSILNNSDPVYSENTRRNLYLFKGLSLEGMGEFTRSRLYLKKSDSIFEQVENHRIQPYERVLFEKLYSYAVRENNPEEKIKYLNRLIYMDSIVKVNYQFFEPILIKNVETPHLFREKEELITELVEKNKKSKLTLSFYIILAIVLFIGACYLIYKQKIYKRRYLALVDNGVNGTPAKNIRTQGNQSLISDSTIREILESLEKFEIKQRFLRTDINLHNLAKSFGTNPKYLSRVVNLKKDTNFPQYLNNLRAEYAAQALKNQKQLRKYSLKAIAQECGFKTAESFTRAFYKRHGIKPTYYLKQLDKEKNDAT